MKIYSISVVKNEEDVIKSNLIHASVWSEKIFVLDNGSTDDTWRIVKELALENPKIVPWKTTDVPFRAGLRAEVYNQFKDISEEGDWWCHRLDADEFYIDDPREFLAAVPSHCHTVCKDSFEYVLTFEDIEEFSFENDFEKNRNKIKYFAKYTYVENRFFKYRKRLTWSSDESFPKYMGVVYNKRIKVKHFQYRSPDQIQKRLDTRNKIKSEQAFRHIKETRYIEKLKHRSELIYDDNESFDKVLGYSNKYLDPTHKYLIKRVLHGVGILP